jgi:hypothetical protein
MSRADPNMAAIAWIVLDVLEGMWAIANGTCFMVLTPKLQSAYLISKPRMALRYC